MADSNPTHSPLPPLHDRRRFVACMIALASLLFLGTASVLYMRWSSMREPACVLVIEAAPPLKGAEITVDSVMFAEPLKSKIGGNSRYAIPFFVEPGEYQVKIKLEGETQFEGIVKLSMRERAKKIDLTHLRPTTMPMNPPAM